MSACTIGVATSESLASATGGVWSEPNSCSWTYTPPSGASFTYDLSAMTKTTDNYKGQDTAYTYQANVCGAVNTQDAKCQGGSSICQFHLDTQMFEAALGSYSNSPAAWSLIALPNQPAEDYTAGVMYTYTNGDLCWVAGDQRTRTVLNVFRCAQSPSDLITVSEDISCTFVVTFQSTQACPGSGPTPSTGSPSPTPSKSSGISGGWIFIIILLVIVPIYVTVGCIYKVKRGGAAFGRDACPNGEFWGSIPGLVKDGCKYTFNMIKSGCKNGRSEAYNEL